MSDKSADIVAPDYELPNKVRDVIDNPLVTVRTSAYNHRNYIARCIDGILSQKTDFAFEFIIGEDFSTDGTREIVFDYAEKYPEIIRVITADSNVGMSKNGERCIKASRGKYMAICEGDDYWTDPYKLQKQVNLLEKNEKVVLVHTGVDYLIEETGKIEPNAYGEKRAEFNGNCFENLLLENMISSVTVMFRMEFLKNYDLETLKRYKMGDRLAWLELSRAGEFAYIPESTAVYRVNTNSASSRNNPERRKAFIESSFQLVNDYVIKYGCSDNVKKHIYKKALTTGFSINSKNLVIRSAQVLSELGELKFVDTIYKNSVNTIVYTPVKHLMNLIKKIGIN